MVAEPHGWRSRELISERIDEQIVDESLETARADLAETSQDRNLLGTVELIPDVLAPEMTGQLVKLPKTAPEDGIQQRTVEGIADIPVPQVVKGLEKVSRVFGQDRVEQRYGGQIIKSPGVSLAERSHSCHSSRKIVMIPEIQGPQTSESLSVDSRGLSH